MAGSGDEKEEKKRMSVKAKVKSSRRRVGLGWKRLGSGFRGWG
jgi:hypothetical protein